MSKPIIEIEDKTPDEQLAVRVRPEIAKDLRAYSEFASSSQGHIVAAALKRLFAADKGFKSFLQAQPEAGAGVQGDDKPKVARKGKAA